MKTERENKFNINKKQAKKENENFQLKNFNKPFKKT